MNHKTFLDKIIDELEIEEEITLETKFREELEDWSSLMGFSLIAFLNSEFKIAVTPSQFIKLETFGDIFNLIKE